MKALDRDIGFSAFDDAYVRAMKLATCGKSFLAQVECQPFISNHVAQVSLEKCRVHVEFAPCPTGVKGSTAFR